MKLKIAVLPGDGIGPEIMKQGVAVMEVIARKFNHEFAFEEALVGACAIEAVGDPYPDIFLPLTIYMPFDCISVTLRPCRS